jgi:hypothetical protein
MKVVEDVALLFPERTRDGHDAFDEASCRPDSRSVESCSQRRCDIRTCKPRVKHYAQGTRSKPIDIGLLTALDREGSQDEPIINIALLE